MNSQIEMVDKYMEPSKLKDEIKKDNLILIPSRQADVGHTILDGYTESGNRCNES